MIKLYSGTITSSPFFKKALHINSKIWSDPDPKIILSASNLNFLDKIFLRKVPSESGYLLKLFETFKYSLIAFGLGPRADSLAESFIFNEGLVNVVQQYVKKGANVYIEGQLSTRKWKDEASGQDKYSTEIVLQGYNSSLTMLDSRNSGNNQGLVSENKSSLPNDNLSQNSDLDDEIPF